MSYLQNNIITATDFNMMASGVESGPNISDTVTNLNFALGVGYGSKGYGQPTVATVDVNDSVAAADWTKLTTMTTAMGYHQQSLISAMKIPKATDDIKYISALQSNIDLVYTNNLNAVKQGTPIVTTVTNTKSWTEKLTFTFQISFTSGNAARYFFNTGGQLKLSGSHIYSGTDAVSNIFVKLLNDIGTLYLSAPSTGSATIGNVLYNGLTQLGATNVLEINPKLRSVFNSTAGYYAWNTTDQMVFKQYVVPTTLTTVYNSTHATVSVKTNGTQEGNGDAGSVITVTFQLVELPTGTEVLGSTTATLSVIQPDRTYLSSSWGNISVQAAAAPTGVLIPPPPPPNIICISVIDECSVASLTMVNSWALFRKNYPSRLFYLLQPGGPSQGSLQVPPAYTSDVRAFGPTTVNRDTGIVANRSDWFTLCNLSAAPAGSKVVLNIDNSGSMRTATVSASLAYFKERCATANIAIAYSESYTSENWVIPFDKSF